MVPVAPDGAVTVPEAIECARRAAGQPVETAAQVVGRVSLDDEVNVVGLDGEVQDAERVPGRTPNRVNECREREFGA
jgi:hypothetical protein